MDLTPYVELLRRELAVAAEAGGEEARALAERLTAPLESAIRLTLLEALSAATAEITRDLAPGLGRTCACSGRDPEFVVTLAAHRPADAGRRTRRASRRPALDDAALPAGDKGGTSRINLRLPDDVKAASRRPPAGSGSRSTPGSSGPPPPRLQPPTRRHAGAGQRGSGRQSFTGWAR